MKHEPLKTKIIEILNDQPGLSQKLTRNWVRTPEGQSKLADLARVIDSEVAQLMMDWISTDTWEKIAKIPQFKRDPHPAAREFIQNIASMELTWEESHEDYEDPFQFLNALESNQLNTLANQFQADEWCLISAYWSREASLGFAKNFKPKERRSFVVAMERMKKIPKDSLQTTARAFANRVNLALETLKETEPSIETVTPVTRTVETPRIRPEEAVNEAIEQFSKIQEKEREIETQVTEYLAEVDPELSAKLDRILNTDPFNDITEVEL